MPAGRRPRARHHLASSPAVAGAEPAAIDEIERAMETMRLEADTVLVRQGEAADRVYIVLEGRLTIALESGRPGGDQLLGDVGPGDVVGEVAVLSGTRRTATVRSRTPVVVGALDRDSLVRVTVAHPELVERLLAGRLRVIGSADRRRESAIEEIGRGQPIGMTSLLTRRPRNATVVAIRDTDPARIPSTAAAA